MYFPFSNTVYFPYYNIKVMTYKTRDINISRDDSSVVIIQSDSNTYTHMYQFFCYNIQTMGYNIITMVIKLIHAV